jgi:hypothetical protein
MVAPPAARFFDCGHGRAGRGAVTIKSTLRYV